VEEEAETATSVLEEGALGAAAVVTLVLEGEAEPVALALVATTEVATGCSNAMQARTFN
jgi:hypothetical protein